MPRANGTLQVYLTFKGLGKKARLELQGKIAKLGADSVELRDKETLPGFKTGQGPED